MANLSEDIQCVENGVNILKSIDEGPFQMGIVHETLVEGTKGAPHLGPERPRVYFNLSPEEKDRYNADIKHYSQSSTTPPSTYVPPHLADNAHLDLGLSSTENLIENLTNTLALSVQGRLNRDQGNNPRGGCATGYEGAQNRVGNANPGGQDKAIDEDMDEQPAQDLALNVDNVFQADDCDAFDSDVDEAPTAQTIFMANLSSAYPVYDEASLSDDLDILSEYVKDNAVPGVQSIVSSIPNDAYMMIYNDMCEPHAQSVSKTSQNTVVDNSLTAELATYKEQVKIYERRARFELTEREQKIDEQLRIVITDRNFKEETLKKELHSVNLQLASTINHNKCWDS
nr:integrase, catalytic region, zinc finger, CCHC-type, peptidase aspartic, catalytic [Tanacetum cinerariifolium]